MIAEFVIGVLLGQDNAAIERSVVNARAAVDRAEFVLHVDGMRRARGSRGRAPREFHYQRTEHFIIDGAKMRRDTRVPCQTGDGRADAGVPVAAGERNACWETICIGCQVGKEEPAHVMYSNSQVPGGGDIAVAVRDLNATTQKQYQISDPRWLGLFLDSARNLRHHESLEEFLSRNTMQTVTRFGDGTIADVVIDDHMAWKVSYARGSWEEYSHWIGRGDLEGCVLRVEFVSKVPGDPLVKMAVSTEYQYVSEARIWFPRIVRYENVEDDTTVRSETVIVDVHSLNSPLSANAFKIEGIEYLKPGTQVHFITARNPRSMVWDGTKVVDGPFSRGTLVPIDNPDVLGRARLRRFVAGGLGLLLLGVLLMWILLHKRSRGRSPM